MLFVSMPAQRGPSFTGSIVAAASFHASPASLWLPPVPVHTVGVFLTRIRKTLVLLGATIETLAQNLLLVLYHALFRDSLWSPQLLSFVASMRSALNSSELILTFRPDPSALSPTKPRCRIQKEHAGQIGRTY